ncbi:SpoIIAA family protein [Psychromonas algicola]|uniref:STAS/SEC14 domain-containing protein n=1 Tax=Psychromonas algicola TaxID=2555642 RepID=UPI001067B268|nr:STAS/SEC14 domain-containing protein [Psychromonas sp. RZ5]TEW47860.1 STAS/SEC14 domain-containing protein [Psychromonas sp. RZ5]
MHQTKSSASPYLYEIKIDNGYKLTSQDVKEFIREVAQGVAVYGYTPSILMLSASSYEHWESLSLLLKVMDTGKLAICSDDEIDTVIENLSALFSAIEIKAFRKSASKEAKEWIIG